MLLGIGVLILGLYFAGIAQICLCVLGVILLIYGFVFGKKSKKVNCVTGETFYTNEEDIADSEKQ